MNNLLHSLKENTLLVADTGDIDQIRSIRPQDATTNPSLIMKSVKSEHYSDLFAKSTDYAKEQSSDLSAQMAHASDYFLVSVGTRILAEIKGRVSNEVDARLSFDTEKTIEKGVELINLYDQMGVGKERVFIKIAATCESIKAAQHLEKIGIKCNLTLIFSLAQTKSCAESNVFLISPLLLAEFQIGTKPIMSVLILTLVFPL